MTTATDAGWAVASGAVAAAELERRAGYLFNRYFPTEGPFRRSLYPKHLALMRAGATFQQRLFLAANRVGKTIGAGYELTCHLTGRHPAWWQGRRFDGPIEAWCAGDTSMTTRDIMQVALMGPIANIDSRTWDGLIPRHLVHDVSRRSGVQDALETVWVRHKSGGLSILNFKSYDQKRQAFQGTAKHIVWLDEEPPDDIHAESLMRLMTTNGLLLVTMTPLQGLTPFINTWLDRAVLETFDEDGQGTLAPAKSAVFKPVEGSTESDPAIEDLARYVVMAGWDDAPHLSADAKRQMAREYQPAQLAARSKGIPALGAGAIYPIPEEDVREKDFEIPAHWPRAFALDAGGGAKPTAAVWGALDREAQVVHVYSVYKRSAAEPAIHVDAIKARGAWIPGVGDCAALLMTEHDAEQLISVYRRGGLDIVLPNKGVETGIQEVWELLSAGRFKVFASCGPWFDEYRLYRRDDKGRIVKQHDHLMDATRYLVRSGRTRAIVKPPDEAPVAPPSVDAFSADPLDWMG